MTNAELKPENVTDILKEHDDFFHSNQTKNINFRIQQLEKLRGVIIKY